VSIAHVRKEVITMYSEEFRKGYDWAIAQHNKEVRQYFIIALIVSLTLLLIAVAI